MAELTWGDLKVIFHTMDCFLLFVAIIFAACLFRLIGRKVIEKQAIKKLDSLSPSQKQIVMSAFNNGNQITLDSINNDAEYLVNSNILRNARLNPVSGFGTLSMNYFLEEYIVKHLSKPKRGKI